MSIEYRTQPVPNATGKYYCQVVEQGTVEAEASLREIAQGTQQTVAVTRAVLRGTGEFIVESILAGQGVDIPGIGKCTASIEATLDGADAPLPTERRVRVRVVLDRALGDSINEQVQFTRLAPENLAPILQTFTVENGVITALDAGCLITVRGSGLECDPAASDQGGFLQPPTGAAIKVPLAKVKTHTEGTFAFFWPTGLTANTTYSFFLKGARKGSTQIRTSNSLPNFHNA